MVRIRDWAWALLLASGPPQAQSQGPPLTGRGWLTKTRVQNQGPGRQGVFLPAHPWGLNWLRVTSDWVSPASRSVSPGETFFSNSSSPDTKGHCKTGDRPAGRQSGTTQTLRQQRPRQVLLPAVGTPGAVRWDRPSIHFHPGPTLHQTGTTDLLP